MPAKLLKIQVAHRPAYHSPYRQVARLRPACRFWGCRPKPLRLVCHLVRRLLKFHETEPLLSGNPALLTQAILRSEIGQKRTDFGQKRTDFVPTQPLKSNE